MSIKNDQWIIEQSTPPRYVVTEAQYTSTGPTSSDLRTKEVTYLSHRTLVELQEELERTKQINWAAGMADHGPGLRSFREVTPEDLQSWQPMIEEFVGSQVREAERGGSREEFLYGKQFGADALAEKLGIAKDKVRVDPILGLQIRDKVISYGVSSFGYDVRIADEFMIFTNVNNTLVDPKNFDDRAFVRVQGDHVVIPPNSFVLARSYEYFRMPRNVNGLVLGKSTYARCGINCIATPLEPGWEGHITLEYINGTPLPAKLYANEGAAQVQFFEGPQPLVSYGDRGGKYQGQRGITLPKA